MTDLIKRIDNETYHRQNTILVEIVDSDCLFIVTVFASQGIPIQFRDSDDFLYE